MHLQYRQMVRDDVPAVFDVRFSTVENSITVCELADDYGITPESLAVAMGEHARGWLCEHDGRAVGFAMGDSLTGEVTVVAVRPDYEGHGIGKAVLGHVCAWLFDNRHEEIWLLTPPAPATRALGFYRRLGWTRSGEMVGDDEMLKLHRAGR